MRHRNQGGRFAAGLYGPGFGLRLWKCDESVKFQQVAELFGLIRGVKLAVALGWKVLHLVGDNTSSILQALGSKASVGLATPQRLLRELVYVWKRSGIQVFIYCVQSALMPADPISRMFAHWGPLVGWDGCSRSPRRGKSMVWPMLHAHATDSLTLFSAQQSDEKKHQKKTSSCPQFPSFTLPHRPSCLKLTACCPDTISARNVCRFW